VALPMLVAIANRGSQAVLASLREPIFRAAGTACQWIGQQLADDGRRGHFAPTGRMAMAATILLILYLLLYYR
jgi:hypothetical protein